MKALILIVLLMPFLCFSQKESKPAQAPIKPPADACPTWKKKSSQNNKTEYYKMLRSGKAKVNEPATNNTKDRSGEITQAKSKKSITPSDEKQDIVSEEKNDEKKVELINSSDSKKTEATVETKEKPNLENERIKRKISHWFSRKSTKAKPKNNSKCPSF